MMQKFRLSGSYVQNGEPGKLSGDFEVDNYGAVYGTVIDEASPVKERKIRGRLDKMKGKMVLDFFVFVLNDSFLNLRYHVEKTGVSAVSGRYAGSWVPVEKTLDFRVIGGPIELASGNSIYPGHVEKLTPRAEDTRVYDAEIYLEKVT
jgi:hypothetical protein